MPFYYYIFLLIVLSIIFIIIRSLILRRKNLPVQLFVKALHNENNGNFEEALIAYESALKEVKKIRFHGSLKNKILEKIKLLHTLIEHKNSFRFTR